jgi:PhnB protein
MALSPYLYFDGDCRQAVAFYAAVFEREPTPLMTYADAPGAQVSDDDRDRVLYAALPVGDIMLMFSDCASGTPYQRGSNICLSIDAPDAAQTRRLFDALADGGQIEMELGPQFFNPLYGMVRDRFGIRWMVMQAAAH